MAVACIYAPSGGGKTVQSTMVKSGFVGFEGGKLVRHKLRGKNLLLCSDNSSIVLSNAGFERPNLDMEPTWNWLDKDNMGRPQICFNGQFEKALESNVYDNIIVDNVSSLFNNAILELDESGRFKDARQAYKIVYDGLKRLTIKAAQAKTNVIFNAWHLVDDFSLPDGVNIKRIQPKLPMKILDDFLGMCNIVAYINTAEKNGEKRWYYVLQGSPGLYAKDQLFCRKSCMPENLFEEPEKKEEKKEGKKYAQ